MTSHTWFTSSAMPFEGRKQSIAKIEKMVFTLIMASRKMKANFQAYLIKVITKQALRKLIESRNHSNQMIDWSDLLPTLGWSVIQGALKLKPS